MLFAVIYLGSSTTFNTAGTGLRNLQKNWRCVWNRCQRHTINALMVYNTKRQIHPFSPTLKSKPKKIIIKISSASKEPDQNPSSVFPHTQIQAEKNYHQNLFSIKRTGPKSFIRFPPHTQIQAKKNYHQNLFGIERTGPKFFICFPLDRCASVIKFIPTTSPIWKNRPRIPYKILI